MKFSTILILLINIFTIGILTVEATVLPEPTGDKGTCADSNCGNYTLNDMTGTAIKISELILGIVGSLSLLAFVAGGLMMMLSGGKAEMVTRGKQTIIGAVIGLVIVFTSYTIIYFVFKALGVPTGNWFTSGWF